MGARGPLSWAENIQWAHAHIWTPVFYDDVDDVDDDGAPGSGTIILNTYYNPQSPMGNKQTCAAFIIKKQNERKKKKTFFSLLNLSSLAWAFTQRQEDARIDHHVKQNEMFVFLFGFSS